MSVCAQISEQRVCISLQFLVKCSINYVEPRKGFTAIHSYIDNGTAVYESVGVCVYTYTYKHTKKTYIHPVHKCHIG